MDEPQKTALLFPCRNVEDQQRKILSRNVRVGDLAVMLILTFDVEAPPAVGEFVPAGLGEAAWHASAGIVDPDGGPVPVPVARWTREQMLDVARIVVGSLDGVGLEESSYWFEGSLSVHCWRAARPGEYATG